MTVMRATSVMPAIRAGMLAWAANLRRRLAVLRHWPLLAAEAVLAGGLVAWVFGTLQTVLFVIWLVLLAGAPGISGLRPGGTERCPYRHHSNLAAQKFCAAGLAGLGVFGDAGELAGSDLLWAASASLPSFMAAIWVWSWWSPEIDTRWTMPGWNGFTQDDVTQE